MKTQAKVICIISLFAISLLSTTVKGQGDEGFYLSAYANYAFDNSFDARYDFGRYYDGKIKGGLLWGIGAEYRLMPETGVELMYLRQDTNAPTNYLLEGTQPEFTDFDLGINYIMLGGIRHASLGSGDVEAHGGLMAGMMIANAKNPETGLSDSATKFAWGIKGGITYWMSSSAGIKLQAQLLSAVQGAGGGLFFGTGGVGAGVSTYSTFYQFTLGGGLVFALN